VTIAQIECKAPRSVTICTDSGKPMNALSGKSARVDRHVT
jgi:hypothetical protein